MEPPSTQKLGVEVEAIVDAITEDFLCAILHNDPNGNVVQPPRVPLEVQARVRSGVLNIVNLISAFMSSTKYDDLPTLFTMPIRR